MIPLYVGLRLVNPYNGATFNVFKVRGVWRISTADDPIIGGSTALASCIHNHMRTALAGKRIAWPT